MPKELAKLSNTFNQKDKTNYGSKFRMWNNWSSLWCISTI